MCIGFWVQLQAVRVRRGGAEHDPCRRRPRRWLGRAAAREGARRQRRRHRRARDGLRRNNSVRVTRTTYRKTA